MRATVALMAVMLGALLIVLGSNTEYFWEARRWATVTILGLMAALIAIGLRLISSQSQRDDKPSTKGWFGAVVVWITATTPVLVFIVWWGFFSDGDF